jgi:hypothetical protein
MTGEKMYRTELVAELETTRLEGKNSSVEA